MNSISIDLKNCYGIKSLNYDFDFSNGKAFLLYAPNGAMKTSLARVFEDISFEGTPRDAVFPNRTTTCLIHTDERVELKPEQVLVVRSYQEDYSSDKISTLLANAKLKKEYEAIYKAINQATDKFISAIGKLTGLRNNIIQQLTSDFGVKDLYILLEQSESQIIQDNDPGLADIRYIEIFNDKVITFLSSPDIQKLLVEYINKYNELIDNSTYFRRGVFTHNNANNVSKSLVDNGFFAAKHTVSLSDPQDHKQEISSQIDFDTVINQEKNRILTNPELAKRFEAIDKAINRNAELRSFRAYLDNNPKILPELSNLDNLKQKLWLSYIIVNIDSYKQLMTTYQAGKKEIAVIVSEAKKQFTLWQKVVSIFNERFSVPFVINIANQDDVILKDESPSLIFRYEDGEDKREIGRDELLSVLSTGEARALYLLNIIFELEARKKSRQETLLILDDIADSFDYKNKYAIIEYLKDILESNNFLMIILTHNFDFFRTVHSRLSINRGSNCLMSMKTSTNVELVRAEYINPFHHWRNNLKENTKILIASIPMVRNLIEYSWGTSNVDYAKLTSVLHQKTDTNSISMAELAGVFNRVLIPQDALVLGEDKVLSIIISEAEKCCTEPEGINLENKIVLAIATRQLAEIFMISKINDQVFVESIESNQTIRLFEKYKTLFSEDETWSILGQVVLMTPEAIHLNSFMYEPLLDLSDCHLKNLFNKVKALHSH